MLLLIDKPKGKTSHDVIDAVRKITGERRVGHAGTLDPNATGLLIVAVGRADTKKLGDLTKNTQKTYVAQTMLGQERDTDDVEGKITREDKQLQKIDSKELEEVLRGFVGKQTQTPPIYSAIKVKGKKAYELARAGKEITMKPREIEVYSVSLLDYDFPKVSVEFCVSSGTYIRSLARDLGRKLGTYAYLSELRRTKIGEFKISDAKRLEEFASLSYHTKI